MLFGFEFFFHVVRPFEGQTKVDKFEVERLRVEESQVLGFEIPMTDAVQVAVVDSLKDLHKYLAGIVLCELPFLVQMLVKLPSFKETTLITKLLSDQVKEAVIFVGFIKFHNVGVVKLFEDLYFADELIKVAHVSLGNLLDGSVGIFLGQHFGLVDCAVCPFSQFLCLSLKGYLLELVEFIDELVVGVAEK